MVAALDRMVWAEGKYDMPVAQSETFVAAPPEEVWALISDLERGPEWSVVTLRCEMTSAEPLGVGSTYRAVSKFAVSKLTTEHEILEWVPPRRIVTRVIKGVESTFTQTCEPQGEGTVLTMSNEFAVPPAVPGFMADKLARVVTDTLAQELTRIKEVVEGASTGGVQEKGADPVGDGK